MDTDLLPDVAKIAVLRANGIGDYLFAVPALEALRAAYPDAEVVLLGLPWHVELLADRPGPVDRVEVVPPWPGVRMLPGDEPDPSEQEAFFARMRSERFDLAVQIHGGGTNSNPFLFRLGARHTVGTATPDAALPDRWSRYVYLQPEVLRYLEVVKLVGARPVTFEPTIAVTDRDRKEAADVLRGDRHDGGDRPLVVLNPGATDPRRRWPIEKMAAAGDALAADGAEVVVSGGQEDVERARAVVEAMRHPARTIAGEVSLCGLVGVLDAADLVISNDSGPLHLARAVTTPTVGVYWLFNVVNAGPVTAHLHRVAVSSCLDCPVCGTNCMTAECDHEESFVADVTVDEVVAQAKDLLDITR